jgi:hypothetical protein
MAVGMASGEGALDHGWVREDEVRATLSAIERELALAMRPPRARAGSRLLRLRLLLLAVESSDLSLEDGLRRLRAALRGAATATCLTWRRRPAAAFLLSRAGVAMDVIWDLLIFLALVAVGLVVLNLLARRR